MEGLILYFFKLIKSTFNAFRPFTYKYVLVNFKEAIWPRCDINYYNKFSFNSYMWYYMCTVTYKGITLVWQNRRYLYKIFESKVTPI